MKRALVLVVASTMILTGCLMEDDTKAEISAGSHYLKGQVIALEACYSSANSTGSTCVGVVDDGGKKRSGRIMGDVQIGTWVYKECTVSSETHCSQTWRTSVGEVYLHGGEVTL